MRLFLLLFLPLSLSAQLDWVADHPATIIYTLDLENVQQHELGVTVHFPAVPPGAFTLVMPQSSPGRYAQHNFAKNVYELDLVDGEAGRALITKTEVNEWVVTGHDGSVTVSYTLFANGGDGTYSGVDDRKLHLNMPASFLYGEQLNDRPVMLVLPADQRTEWTVASQLVDLGQRRYAAPDYYYFYDSPTMVGDIMRADWEVVDGERSSTIEVAMIHDGTREEFDDYVDWVKQIVNVQRDIYGELPEFDFGRYTFLCAYNAYIGGDGMEHRNSTICSAPISLADGASRLIGTVSHEFFHAWNVERIRPASLEPFEFDHVNMSGELWFAEGFTSYYDDLALVRAGIEDYEDYARNLAGLFNYVVNRPGRNYHNPIAMSQMAPFVDAATANDPDNFANTFVSYYPYGEVLALALDLELRQRGHTLDAFMQSVWRRYGKPEIPYHVRDLQLALGDLIEDRAWAADWFDNHIYDSQLPDFGELLPAFGFTAARGHPDTVAFDGLRLRYADGAEVIGTVLENNPLYAAGVDRGSIIMSINDRPVNSDEEWKAAVAELRPGKNYKVVFTQLGRQKTGIFTAASSMEWRVVPGMEMTPESRLRMIDWLGD